ncbi:winged helix-turn-helix domain-containing protein [Bacillus smithii]|uniref:winged helix-turn-helix domain-containing protein n=1 Tax=Bacillus smithii TaxID=1479 RepID=UPI002E20A852|nr:winged helix-turn-helix domain-containing protein [Bacillus smithii]MED1456790.1 winged helix-turn-helix domain-containing protein [Bacillus smithii]
MTIEKIVDSINEIEEILKIQEWNGYYVNVNPFGEVKLDKRGLYPDMNTPLNGNASTNSKIDHRKQLNLILNLLNYSDGEHSLLDIAEISGYRLHDFIDIVELLKEKGLLEGPYYEVRSLFV